MKRLAVLLAVVLGASSASAQPTSIWTRIRRPELHTRRALVAEAEALQIKYYRLFRERPRHALDRDEVEALGRAYLLQAAQLLGEAGAARSRDLFLRQELAGVLGSLGEHRKAIVLLEGIVRAEPPPVLRARAWAELAVAYAHAGRVEDEVRAYGEALRVEPTPRARARLFANRAEAYMLLGDIEPAVEGYRTAIGLLSPMDFISELGNGATTLWGLAVALDRSGDLDAGIETVWLARSYDAQDKQLNSRNWFYMPAYDRYWYAALGHWMVARKSDMGSVRAEAYGRAVAAWNDFVSHAAADDKWAAVGRARLERCEKERADFTKREAARRAAQARGKGKKAPHKPGDLHDELMKGWDPGP